MVLGKSDGSIKEAQYALWKLRLPRFIEGFFVVAPDAHGVLYPVEKLEKGQCMVFPALDKKTYRCVQTSAYRVERYYGFALTTTTIPDIGIVCFRMN